MATEEIVATDQISEMPELVLHHILSFLPAKDAARTSALSKRWRSLWDTLPCLNFGEGFVDLFHRGYYKPRLNTKRRKKNSILLHAVDRIIERRSQPNPDILKFCLHIPDHKLSKKQKLLWGSPLILKLERWISCLARSSLRELDLRISRHLTTSHMFPLSILLVKSLNVLTLHRFNLSPLSSQDINFPALKELLLSVVSLDDSIMKKLILGCPLLEKVRLRSCKGLKAFNMTGLLHLKEFKVHSLFDLKILAIDAPKLLVLEVVPFQPYTCFVNFTSCPVIRELKITNQVLFEETPSLFVSHFPFLEVLKIGDCAEQLEHFKIKSDCLRELRLGKLQDLAEVEITAPALEKFVFRMLSPPPATLLLNASNMREVELNIFPDDGTIGIGYYDELTKFLRHFDHVRTVTIYGILNEIIIPENNRSSLPSPLCGTRNLVFTPLYREKLVDLELFKYLLWLSPRPDSLLITKQNYKWRNLTYERIEDTTWSCLKFVYDQENEQKDLSCSHCKFLPVNCWRHSLVEVSGEIFEAREPSIITRIKDFFLQHAKNVKIIDTSIPRLSDCDLFSDGLYTYYDELFLNIHDLFRDGLYTFYDQLFR